MYLGYIGHTLQFVYFDQASLVKSMYRRCYYASGLSPEEREGRPALKNLGSTPRNQAKTKNNWDLSSHYGKQLLIHCAKSCFYVGEYNFIY